MLRTDYSVTRVIGPPLWFGFPSDKAEGARNYIERKKRKGGEPWEWILRRNHGMQDGLAVGAIRLNNGLYHPQVFLGEKPVFDYRFVGILRNRDPIEARLEHLPLGAHLPLQESFEVTRFTSGAYPGGEKTNTALRKRIVGVRYRVEASAFIETDTSDPGQRISFIYEHERPAQERATQRLVWRGGEHVELGPAYVDTEFALGTNVGVTGEGLDLGFTFQATSDPDEKDAVEFCYAPNGKLLEVRVMLEGKDPGLNWPAELESLGTNGEYEPESAQAQMLLEHFHVPRPTTGFIDVRTTLDRLIKASVKNEVVDPLKALIVKSEEEA